jgi:multicomponent Na+:H+ antiporter subunit D
LNDDLILAAHQHAPMLAIIAPLTAVALCALSPSGRLAWVVASIAAIVAMACALDVTMSVQSAGARLYAAGGWQTNLGVTLRIDGLGAFGLSLVSVAGALAIISSIGPLRRDVERRRQPLAMALCALVTCGALGMIAAGDLFTVFVFMQMSAIGAAALVGMGAEADRRAAPAGLRVLMWSSVGAIFYALGAGLMFLSTGSFDIARAAAVLNAAEHARGAVAGVALMIAGLGIAAAVAPLHAGLVAALGRGPSFAAPLLGVALAAAGLMALARLMALLVGASAPGISNGASVALVALGVSSVVIGSMQAAAATDLRRLVAYATAAQAGCVAIGLATSSLDGMIGALFHALNQALVAFVFLGVAAQLGAGAPMAALDGLGKRAPALAAALTIAALSLVGAPLTAGFLSKWLLLQATLEARLWGGAVAIVASTMVSMIYVARLLERLYVRPVQMPAAPFARGGWTLAPAMVAAVIAALVFGVESAAPLNAAHAAVDAMAWGPNIGGPR